MKMMRNNRAFGSRVAGMAALTVGVVLAFAVMARPASADTLHGFCWGSATCSDGGSNTPTTANPPQFGFAGSGKDVSGDFVLVFLIPDTVTSKPTSIAVSGTLSGTADLVSGTPWSSGQLDSYLGISASPSNPIGAFGVGFTLGQTVGYYVYEVNFGSQTLGGTSDPTDGPEETSDALPIDSYIVGFLDVPGDKKWSATANSGAILEEDGPPPTTTPEPSSLALLGTGALGLAGVVRRKFRRA